MSQLILIRGIPGSGKSTLANVLVGVAQAADIEVKHFEADQFFIDENGDYKFDFNNLREAHDACRANTRQALEEGFPVIVSNTFTTIKELKPYFAIAKEFGIVPQVILAQNSFGSVHGVPEDKMLAMKKRFVYNIDPLFETLLDKKEAA